MPRQSAWFVRLSLIYLVLGFSLGAMMLANEGLVFAPHLGSVLPIHFEVLLIGWMMQCALGVAYWILPRFPQGLPRGNQTLAWLSLITLNSGILLAAGSIIRQTDWLLIVGRLFEAAGIGLFLYVAWRRVRPSMIRI